jgi:hypothetical protein
MECFYIFIHNTTTVGPILQITIYPRLMLLQKLSNGCSQETKEYPTSHTWPMDLQLNNPALAYTTGKST